MKETSISHYRVVGQLGRGGIGIVYRAEDTRLDRTVALKVLPPHALVSADDRARFYREARAAAALSHPNIAHVYEIDESEVEGESRPFIAMEYIDGETLTDRILIGPLPLKDAVSIASQVAEGLKAAHDKDIVHRDVKSGNIMLTSSGVPKILDFGLAKTAASTKLTQMGSTLGTVAYMSPEQARGEEVDRRSDIWSLGVILYEMISGRMPFPGDYEQAIVYGILNAQPEPLTALRTGVPMELERIVNKCLAKDPARRYPSAADLIVDLEAVSPEVSGLTAARSTMYTGTLAPRAEKVSAGRGLLMGSVAAALAVGLIAGVLLRPGEQNERRPLHMSIVSAQERGMDHPSMSPDGRYVAYSSAGGRLILQDLSTNERRIIVSNGDARISRFSPDSRWLAFEHGGTGLSIIQVPDGAVARLSEAGQMPSWVDNETVIFSDGVSIFRMSRITQEREVLWEPTGSEIEGLTHPEVLPGGERILVTVLREPLHGIAILTLDSGEVRVLRDGAIAPRYVSSGHLVFTDQPDALTYRGRVFAQPFDLSAGVTRGPAVPVLSDRGYWTVGISGRGDLITTGAAVGVDATLEVRFLDPASGSLGDPILTVSTDGWWGLSHDGNWFASADFEDNILEVGPVDPEGGGTLQFSTPRQPSVPVFSHDGNTLYYTEGAFPTELDAFRRSLDGGPPEDLDFGGHRFEFVTAESQDGRFLQVTVADDWAGVADFLLVDTETGEQTTILSGSIWSGVSLSPDGRWLTYSEEGEVFVRGVDGTGPWRIASERVGPQWSPDGATLFVRDDIHIYALPLTIGRGVRPGPERLLYTGTESMSYGVNYATGDLIIADLPDAESGLVDRLDVVLNWGEWLKLEAPVQ
jgi:serine/threonine protein kinase